MFGWKGYAMRNDSLSVNFIAGLFGGGVRHDGIVAESFGRGVAAIELTKLVSKNSQRLAGWPQKQPSAGSEFSFRDRWEVHGRIEDVAQTLLNTDAISCWWPQL